MTERPVELDEHRGMAAQKSTELRRRLHEVQADQAALWRRQDEFERYALAAPSATWPEAVAKARYLIQLFAATPEAQDPRRQKLIAKVLDELARLSDQPDSMSASPGTSE
jgi:DNA-binding IclR family transcriptional regulator